MCIHLFDTESFLFDIDNVKYFDVILLSIKDAVYKKYNL